MKAGPSGPAFFVPFSATDKLQTTFAHMALHTRPRDLLAVALPISAGTLLQFVVVLTDNYFLSKLPESAINGAGNAGLVYLTLEMLAIASAASLQILIARRIGEGDRPAALRVFRTGVGTLPGASGNRELRTSRRAI